MSQLETPQKLAGTAAVQQHYVPSIVAWCPPASEGARNVVVPPLKLRQIAPGTAVANRLGRIIQSWLRCLYQKHLKRIPGVRWLRSGLLRKLYLIYRTIYARWIKYITQDKEWLPLVKLRDYVAKWSIEIITVFDEVRVATPVPKVFPAADQGYLIPPHDHYEFPAVYVAALSNTWVYGGTNLVFVREAVICHDLYDFERDYSAEELGGRHVIDATKMRLRVLRHDAAPEQIAVAATFVDACASNYAHWLTEVMPRIATFCSMPQFATVPIIVNAGLHCNIMESLALLVGAEREVITLPIGRVLLVKRLYVTSVAGYVPFDKRNAAFANHSHGRFCPPALQLLRRRFAACMDDMALAEWPRKIYLRRNAAIRQVTNRHEIEHKLWQAGYVIVAPEQLTFLQQVALFSNAEVIVGSSGAALANLIFAKPRTAVYIFISKFAGTSYWYWQNIACASGKKVIYILGQCTKHLVGIHADFEVALESIYQALRMQ